MSFINNTTTIDSMLVPYFPEELEIYQISHKIVNFSLSNLYPVIFGIGSLWNFLIIIYFLKTNSKNLKKMSSYHFLIINLAIVDLCISVGMSIASPIFVKPPWDLGTFECIMLIPFIESVCPMLSCWLLVLISFARFRSIVYPLRERISKKKCGLCVFVVLLAISVSNLKFFMTIKSKQIGSISMCVFDSSYENFIVQISITYIVDSFFPLAIMLFLYNEMYKRMNRRANGNSFALTDQSRQRNRRALRTIRGLIWLFILTVILGRVYNLLSRVLDFYKSNNKPPFLTMLDVFIWVSYSLNVLIYFMNNILNIFIYAKMIPDFRRFLLTVFTFGMYGKRNAIN